MAIPVSWIPEKCISLVAPSLITISTLTTLVTVVCLGSSTIVHGLSFPILSSTSSLVPAFLLLLSYFLSTSHILSFFPSLPLSSLSLSFSPLALHLPLFFLLLHSNSVSLLHFLLFLFDICWNFLRPLTLAQSFQRGILQIPIRTCCLQPASFTRPLYIRIPFSFMVEAVLQQIYSKATYLVTFGSLILVRRFSCKIRRRCRAQHCLGSN